jgi:hypothetical protein
MVDIFCLPNTTSLSKAMEQGSISTYKTNYLRKLFKGNAESNRMPDNVTLKGTGRHENMSGTTSISAARCDVTNSCMNSVRRKLWPDCVPGLQERDIILASVTENATEIAEEARQDGGDVDGTNTLLENHSENSQRQNKHCRIFCV